MTSDLGAPAPPIVPDTEQVLYVLMESQQGSPRA